MFRTVSTSAVLLLLVFSLITQGCATIIHGSHQDLPIETVPPGVKARIDKQSCMTPCTLRVSRLAEQIHIATEGDTEITYPLFKSVNIFEFYVGNLIFLFPGATIGALIDWQDGAKYTIKPVKIFVPDDNK